MRTRLCDGSSKKRFPLLLGSLLLASAALSPAIAQVASDPYRAGFAPALASADLAQSEAADQLEPGEFEWLPTATKVSDAEVMIIVSLRDQRAYVYRDGERIAISTVSTGKRGKETPTGVFEILQKKKVHHSNLYDDAPMPFMQRLTWDGVALHAGRIPGHPASHGCIRLPKQFAKELYEVTKHGQTVVVSEDGSVDALARAGLSEHLALLVGTSSSLRELAEAVDGEHDYAPSGSAIGTGSATHAAAFSE